MNKKQVGILLIIIGILLSGLTYSMKVREDNSINAIILIQGGSCYLPDGTCLHEDRSYLPYIFGWIISSAIILLGVYLIFFDKTEKILEKSRQDFKEEVKSSKKAKEFDAFLSGFNAEEQIVLKAVNDNEGILQSTLRYKTGISKTGLSLLLKSLEDREIISRTIDGKSNKVYLIQKF